jgi:PIN domain nuclease of toxin-antitoxin system
MRLLIDSQSLIWYVDQDHLLTPVAHAGITDPNNDLLLSAATIWEIAIKVGLKKLSLSMPYKQWITKAMTDLDMIVLPSRSSTQTSKRGYRIIIETPSTECWWRSHRWRIYIW